MNNMNNLDQFRKSFKQLSAEEQEILMLRHIDGHSLLNLAVILKLPSLKYSRNLIRDLEVKILHLMSEN